MPAILCLLIPAPAHAEEPTDALKEKVKQSEEKKDTLKKELEQIQGNIHGVEAELSKIQLELSATQSKISGLTKEITAKNTQITKKEIEIQDTQAKLQKKRTDLGDSIAFMDQTGELEFVQFVIQSFQSSNLAETLAAFDFLSAIADENQRLLEEIRKQETHLQGQKKQLSAEKTTLDSKMKEMDYYKSLQLQQKNTQDQLLNEFKNKESELIQHIQEEEAAQAALHATIAEAFRQREIERANSGFTPLPDAYTGGKVLAYPMQNGSYSLSSLYGYRTHPVYGDRRLHNGVDFAAPNNTPIYAAEEGYVLYSGAASGYGNWIVIEHDNGLYSIYGHMEANQLYVSAGERVTRGQHIAGVGSSGTSTGFHLHYSVATGYDGNAFTYIDPMAVLR